MGEYAADEIDITQWKPQKDDRLLLAFKKLGNTWKCELHKSYGLYYKTFVKESKIKEILTLGWELQKDKI